MNPTTPAITILDPQSAAPADLKVIPFSSRPKVKRRVRPAITPGAPIPEATAGLHACEPQQSFIAHLNAANEHLRTADDHEAYLSLHLIRSLWGLARYDEAFAAATNLAIEEQWDTVDKEYEELDPTSRAVLAADRIAAMPGHRVFNFHFALQLRRASLMHRLISYPGKAA